ncbi:MAG: YbaK/EbsC family protein [Spirochaetaceae bacterium]|jgi:prolyl-tRNA editing enzyme YbaK/EbsC (Cys-tRNA(Pro) deacylase)|nr:YbaK/EbsC family protein [Spirochaetaceae bacterium]
MSIESAREHLKQWGRHGDVIESRSSTATVAEAAAALGVIPARIAKSISLKTECGAMLILSAGDVKLDNKKFKECFGYKARMLTADEALEATGHAIGGVCPFGLPSGVDVYLDVSLRRFATVFPACGSGNSAIELTLDELHEYARNKRWIDVCKSADQTPAMQSMHACTKDVSIE